MKKYLVKVMFEFDEDIEVEANDPYEANAIAEAVMAEAYSIVNNNTKELLPFQSIVAYDPEEIN